MFTFNLLLLQGPLKYRIARGIYAFVKAKICLGLREWEKGAGYANRACFVKAPYRKKAALAKAPTTPMSIFGCET